MKKLILFIIIGLFSVNLFAQSSQNSIESKKLNSVLAKSKFDGKWLFEERKNGFDLSLAVDIKQVGNKLTGEYYNVSSKESTGKITSSKITGNTAIINIDCDWGGKGKVKLTLLKGNRLHWQVVKYSKGKGEFIVLLDKILKKTK